MTKLQFSGYTLRDLANELTTGGLVSAVLAIMAPRNRSYSTNFTYDSVKDFWSKFDWSQIDTDAPKPTYEEALRIWEARYRAWIAGRTAARAVGDGATHFDRMPLDHSVLDDIYAGAGLEHMPAAIHLLSAGADAGVHHPRMVMRNGDHLTGELWTRAHAEELLNALAARTNRVESAKNALVAHYRLEYAALAAGAPVGKIPSQADLDANKAKFDELLARLTPEKIEAEFAAKMAELADEAALPADLATAREVLVERLEAAAMRRVKEIKGARTQQGVDVPATCLDMANALEEVSQASALGIQAVEAADDIAAAAAAFDAAVAKIEAVTPLNVPEWEHAEATILGHELTVRARHPAGQNIAGDVSFTFWAVSDGNGDPLVLEREITRPGGGAVQMTIKLRQGIVYPVTMQIGARNLCGPSTLDLDIDDPSA